MTKKFCDCCGKEIKGIKIASVVVKPTTICDTYSGAIIVKAKINGFSLEFIFGAARSGNIWFTGIDCDEAIINGKRIDISNGGGQTHYALRIPVDVLKSAPKLNQKDFQFTGQIYSTVPIVSAFKKIMQDLFKEGLLTQQFLKAIGY